MTSAGRREDSKMNQPISRRSVLGTGTLFFGTGLLGVAGSRPEPVQAAEPITLATVVNADDLAAECRDRFETFKESREASARAWDQLAATLTPEQAKLARDASDA